MCCTEAQDSDGRAKLPSLLHPRAKQCGSSKNSAAQRFGGTEFCFSTQSLHSLLVVACSLSWIGFSLSEIAPASRGRSGVPNCEGKAAGRGKLFVCVVVRATTSKPRLYVGHRRVEPVCGRME